MKYICLSTIEPEEDSFSLNMLAIVSMYVDEDGLNIVAAKEWMNNGDGDTIVVPCDKDRAEGVIRRLVKEDSIEIEAFGYYHDPDREDDNKKLFKLCKEKNNRVFSSWNSPIPSWLQETKSTADPVGALERIKYDWE